MIVNEAVTLVVNIYNRRLIGLTKDIMDAIRERRSIRRFTTDPVSDATLGRLLEAAHLAPSAGNRQPWFFYVVKSKEKRQQLVDAALGQRFLVEAPVNIVVCAEPQRSAQRYGERGASLYCLQDTAAAVQNILLAATAFGLATCWVGAFDESKVASVLNMPDTLRPVAIVPVGYSNVPDRLLAPPRRGIDEIVQVVE